jgi:hypothetical protein
MTASAWPTGAGTWMPEKTTYAVGPVPDVAAVYLDRADAEAAADQLDGTYIEWSGSTRRQMTTAEYQASTKPELASAIEFKPEPEIGL